MPEIGLTGGIGSGKSTVAEGLAARGAFIIDADAEAQKLQVPGKPVFEAMVERWGNPILSESGTLNRSAVATIVFNDPVELSALNSIVHPSVVTEIRELRRAIRDENDDSAVIVLDIPLLLEVTQAKPENQASKQLLSNFDSWDVDGIIVMDTEPTIALQRLTEQRGFNEKDALARIATQATNETRLAIADFVINNNGTHADLERQIKACWLWICSLLDE